MALIIAEEHMPNNCAECPCCRHDSYDGIQIMQCNLTLIIVEDYGYESRAKDCPLKEMY